MQEILKVENLQKVYSNGSKELTVLENINFTINEGESVSIIGTSGSGKTTLLGLCAGLDNVSSGSIHLCQKELNNLSEDQRADVRNYNVGFVFQNFQLIPTLTAMENILIPLELQGKSDRTEVAMQLLERVGLADRANHYPNQLSGGEQQRISIARAFSNQPKILFADEPTGNLDEATGAKIEKLIFDLNKEQNTTLVLVTHDLELAKKTDRVIKLKGGKIIEDLTTVK